MVLGPQGSGVYPLLRDAALRTRLMTTPFGKSRKLLEVADDADLDEGQAQALLGSPAFGALLRSAKEGTLAAFEAALCAASLLLESIELVVGATLDATLLPSGYRGWEIPKGENVRVDNPSGDLKLSLVEFLKPDDKGSVVGEEMRRRVLEGGVCAGELVALALFKNQRAIPKSWRIHPLVFAGSLRQCAGGFRCVLYLVWYGERWVMSCYWLDDGFYGYYRVVRCG